MFRRPMNLVVRNSVATRKFTDYVHREYPHWTLMAYAFPVVYLGGWVFFLRMGSVWTKRSEYKKDLLRCWRRRLGTGYRWSDEFGPEIKSVYTNLPSRAE